VLGGLCRGDDVGGEVAPGDVAQGENGFDGRPARAGDEHALGHAPRMARRTWPSDTASQLGGGRRISGALAGFGAPASMDRSMLEVTFLGWAATLALIAALFILDLFISRPGHAHTVAFREAVVASLFYIGVALRSGSCSD
jgi:hypothetical protein